MLDQLHCRPHGTRYGVRAGIGIPAKAPVISLAAIRYRNVLAEHGGPIKSIDVARIGCGKTQCFQANARLRDGLALPPVPRSLYGTCHGTGTHRSALIARYIAVSEALERWAHYAAESGPAPSKGGFDIDPSSNGMAAFPGLTHRPARRRALLEAIERASLFEWWEGRGVGTFVPQIASRVDAVRLGNPLRFGVTAITFQEFAPGWFSYGHAAAENWRTACARAAVEMQRGAFVLDRHRRLQAEGNAPTVPGLWERRSLFFASREGHELFQQRLRCQTALSPRPWRIAFDAEIKGPWSRYATVWRVVIPPLTPAFLTAGERYFFW